MPKASALAIAVLLLATVLLWQTGRRWANTSDSSADSQPAVTRAPAARLESPQKSVENPEDRAILQEKDIAKRAHQNLSTIFRLAASPSASTAEWTKILDDRFTSDPLRPNRLQRIYRDDCVLVQRGRLAGPQPTATPATSAKKLPSLLSSLRTVLASPEQWHAAITVIDVQSRNNRVTTPVIVALTTGATERRAQIRSLWHCQWNHEADRLRLKSIRVVDYEEVIARYPDQDWLVECTPSVIGHNPSYNDQLVFGPDHWLDRIQRIHQMDRFSSHGVAVGDANGDGLDDIYVCQPGGLPNRLYLQNPDGTAHDVSMRSRTDWLDNSSSALFVDLDNDGDQDLIIATHTGLLTMKNDGAARFALSASIDTSDAAPQSLSAADYDNDSDLDLYLCFGSSDIAAGRPAATPSGAPQATQPGPPNRLLRNDLSPDGQWRFVDATRASGIDADNRHHSFAAAWEDFDDDGDPDLFVANRDGGNCLYENSAGRFANIARQLNVAGTGAGNSVNWIDYDRDAQMDLYVGAAGEHASPLAAATLTRRAPHQSIPGNSSHAPRRTSLLLHRADNTTFQPVGGNSDVHLQQPAWCSLALDLNNDGFDELVTAARSLRGWLNLGVSGAEFADISTVSGLNLPDEGRAIAASDWDQDGDLDLWIANRSAPQLRLLMNETPTNQHYVALRLVGKQCNRDAIGAQVEVVLQGTSQRHRKTLRAGEGYLSQSSKWLHFGLGRAPRIERVDVRWPGGIVESFQGLTADGHYRLTQGTGTAEPVTTGERTIVISPAPAPQPNSAPLQIVLATPLTTPQLTYITSRGDTQPIRTSGNRPLVLHLATNDSDDSLVRLNALAARHAELPEAGIDLIALAVAPRATHPPVAVPALQRSEQLQFPFISGRAGRDLIDRLQQAVRQCFDSDGALPIPCTLLFAGDGRLSAIYTGPVTVERLRADVAKLELDDAQRRAASLPFAGRWASRPAAQADDQRAVGPEHQRQQLQHSHGEANRRPTAATIRRQPAESLPL